MKSRRNTSKKLNILIDTSFLLPALGIEVEDEAMKVIPLFRKVNVYYLEIALLEAVWKILRIVDKEKLKEIELGLKAIRNTYRVIEPPPEAYINAIKIYDEGHKDYIDAVHYATAKVLQIPWLTIDYRFLEFLKNKNFPVEDVILTPEDLSKTFK